jgi:hypothetical protein
MMDFLKQVCGINNGTFAVCGIIQDAEFSQMQNYARCGT